MEGEMNGIPWINVNFSFVCWSLDEKINSHENILKLSITLMEEKF